MHKKAIFALMLVLLFVIVSTSALNTQPVKSWTGGTIYIRDDGSIDPPDAPIQRDGDLYTLTSDISSDNNGIVIQRNNIVLDGACHTIIGPGKEILNLCGIDIGVGRNNITIKKCYVKNFRFGIDLGSSDNDLVTENNVTECGSAGINLSWSNNNTIIGNSIMTNDDFGILLLQYCDYNKIFNNSILDNRWGITCSYDSDYTEIVGNIIEGNANDGIQLAASSSNFISKNNIRGHNRYGIGLQGSMGNLIYHNNFIDNAVQAYVYDSSFSSWDNGYPSGGNYWNDYSDVDMYCGPNQDILGSDGIWDHRYVIDANNQDKYPLVWCVPFVEGDINRDGIVDIFDIVIVAADFGRPIDPPLPISDPRADVNRDGIVDVFDLVIVAADFGKTDT